MSKVFLIPTVAMVIGLITGLLVAIDKAAALPDVHFSYLNQ